MPTLVGAAGFVPTKVGTYQSDTSVVTGVVPAAGRQSPLVDADLGRRCGFVPTKVGTYQSDTLVVAGVVPATGRQPVLVDADLGRRCGFRANQGWHLPERYVG
ncbi:hypothetical protein, partial [Stenotrophomonas maltophilia]|uniref:hypothetical protein n=2 Tax=Stenotrophomonas maltophilia TaxID=40324 RepID=UPI0021C97D87